MKIRYRQSYVKIRKRKEKILKVFGIAILSLLFITIFCMIFVGKAEAVITYTPDGYRFPPTAIISAAQDFTGAWVDLGSEIQTDGYNWLKLWLQVDINNTLNARIRVLEKTALAGALEYTTVIETIGTSDVKTEQQYYEINVDADQNVVILIELRNTCPVIQVQIQAGTVGATAGQIDSAYYSLGK